MAVPTREIAGCAAAHARVNAAITNLGEADARRPSLLPGWTVGHVLTHLARNAASVTRRLEGAARDEVVDQYVGGFVGRAADIDAGADRPAAALVADVRETSSAVDALCARLGEDVWDRPTRTVAGDIQPASAIVFSRWREVEVHHVDLGLGYTPDCWPSELVDAWLPRVLSKLGQRTDPNALLAWTLGRGPAPDLDPWR
ncbi:MAG TPA: maleylpyruvate isomerase N-terminal domain-containing protein [Acidimicrobiia bacterium]|jgi:maleylpyruvate isomerase